MPFAPHRSALPSAPAARRSARPASSALCRAGSPASSCCAPASSGAGRPRARFPARATTSRRAARARPGFLNWPLVVDRRCDFYLMVRREGFEPTRLAPPAPKAGASTRSAPLAAPMSVGHYEISRVASLLLPRGLREPIEIIYRFARTADDFADEGDEPNDLRLSRLSGYRAGLERIARGEPPQAALFDDIARIVRAHGLPLGLF